MFLNIISGKHDLSYILIKYFFHIRNLNFLSFTIQKSVLQWIVGNYIREVWWSMHPKQTLWTSAESLLEEPWGLILGLDSPHFWTSC